MSTLKPLLFIFTVVFLSKPFNPLLRKSGFPISESFDKYSPELTFTMRYKNIIKINEKFCIFHSVLTFIDIILFFS